MKRKPVSLLENVKGGILIVDGGQAFHRKIVNLLADTGFRVETTTSGEMVLEEVQEKGLRPNRKRYRIYESEY